jgi:hypothetical protein
MKDILRQSNLDLLREINQVVTELSSFRPGLKELSPYYNWALSYGVSLRQQVVQNLHDLEVIRDVELSRDFGLSTNEIFGDILSETQEITRWFRLYNQRLVSPVLRSLPSDQLCLRLLQWLHQNYQETKNLPLCFTNAEFSILPAPPFSVIYSIPSSAQYGLLYLPLFFHEFGHLLYVSHDEEMKDLVRDLQQDIADELQPALQRDDLYSQEKIKEYCTIVETWYFWIQELFCDAVGLVIGGPCFIKAFSIYLRMTGREAFHRLPEDLYFSTHPVTWVRIQLIADRAHQLGLKEEARSLKREWNTIAKTLQMREDYYGFYDESFLPIIRQTIDNMLEEASPHQFTDQDLSHDEWNPKTSTPVHLLNVAWNKFSNNPEDYSKWEKKTIKAFLKSK